MRPVQLVVFIVFGLFIAGCGTSPSGGLNNDNTAKPTSAPSPTASSPPSATTPSGIVRGQVLRPPGPDPRSGNVGSTVPISGDPVRAKDSSGQVVANAATGPDGHFELTLPPGTYTIGEDTCGVSQKIEIHAGATTSTQLSITNAC